MAKPVNGKEKLEIKIFTQSYREAKESGIVSELEGVRVVTGSSKSSADDDPFDNSVLQIAYNRLRNNAEKVGCSYVFGLDYKVERTEEFQYTFVYGDAYKPKA